MTEGNRRAGWLVPTGLILLSAVPLLAGGVRLNELAAGADITPANARFFAAPVPVVAHIVATMVYTVLGAFQFVPRLRARRPGWHRGAGRLLVAAGLVTALSGIWMTIFYALPAGDQGLLTALRLGFGTAMVASIVLGVVAIRRRDVRRHRAWMTRAYAIGLGAGSQFVAMLVWNVAVGTPDDIGRALLMGAGWVTNVAVAEWVIRRR